MTLIDFWTDINKLFDTTYSSVITLSKKEIAILTALNES